MRIKIHYKITIAFCLILAAVLTGIFIYLNSTLRDYTYQRIKTALFKEALLAKLFLEKDFPGYMRLKEIDGIADKAGNALDSRVTVIGLDGAVLGDSDLTKEEIAGAENHLYRPEVQEALGSGEGESVRFSTTIRKNMLYVAMVFGKEGPEGIVRLSLSLADIDMVSEHLKRTLFFALALTFGFAVLASMAASVFITRPLKEISATAGEITRGDFSRKIVVNSDDEIGDLAKAFNQMSDQIKSRIEEVMRNRSRFEAILLSMFDGVMVVDARNDIILMNPRLMAALTVESDPAGKKPLEVMRNIEVQEIADKTLGLTEGVESREISIRMPEDKTFQVHATPIIREGRAEGAVLVFHDITELRRLEKIRRDFVANVSHELRTPISNIKGYVETLKEGAIRDADNAGSFLDIIKSNSDRLENLIEDLLDLSRIESGKLDLSLRPLRICEVVNRVIAEMRKQAEEKGISIESDISPDIPSVMADRTAVAQILINLIDNAIKYSGDNGRVIISALNKSDLVEIKVSDNGSGIAEEHLPRIFERFYRVDKARSVEMGGTGLGLSIVKHLVHEHGGRVSVQSVPGRGSTFSFTVPTARV